MRMFRSTASTALTSFGDVPFPLKRRIGAGAGFRVSQPREMSASIARTIRRVTLSPQHSLTRWRRQFQLEFQMIGVAFDSDRCGVDKTKHATRSRSSVNLGAFREDR